MIKNRPGIPIRFALDVTPRTVRGKSRQHEKSLFSFIPLSFASLPTKSLSGQAPERGKEKGFSDPKEISPSANHGCRQH
jgi:hypothetical protein